MSDFEYSTVSTTYGAKTPNSKSRKTPTRKTPKGDRFIPSGMDLEISHFNLLKENSDPNTGSGASNGEYDVSSENYKNALADALFEGKSVGNGSKILTFKAKAPEPKPEHQNSLRILYSQNKENAEVSRKQRHIPQAPERILDAPDLVDDYYLNLLDWSSNNLLAIALGNTVYLWNATTSEIQQLMQTPEQGNYITSLSWIKEGNYLAVGTNDCAVQLWDVEKTKRVREMRGHTGRIGALAWNSFILSSGSRDTQIHNHDVRIQQHHVSTLAHHTQEVCGLKWSPDGAQLASGGNDNLLCLWDINTRHGEGPSFALEQHTAAVRALAWCPWQSNLLASGGGTADRTIRFWNTATGACLNSIDTKSQVCSLQWSTHRKEIVSSHGFSQNQLTVWSYPAMVKLADLTGHTSRVLHTAISPDGETICSAAGDETLRFWKVFEREHKPQATRKLEKNTSLLRSASSLIR